MSTMGTHDRERYEALSILPAKMRRKRASCSFLADSAMSPEQEGASDRDPDLMRQLLRALWAKIACLLAGVWAMDLTDDIFSLGDGIVMMFVYPWLSFAFDDFESVLRVASLGFMRDRPPGMNLTVFTILTLLNFTPAIAAAGIATASSSKTTSNPCVRALVLVK